MRLIPGFHAGFPTASGHYAPFQIYPLQRLGAKSKIAEDVQGDGFDEVYIENTILYETGSRVIGCLGACPVLRFSGTSR